MRPVHEHTGWRTFDLTEAKVCKLVQPDGSAKIVAFFPKTYTPCDRVTLVGANGETFSHRMYNVTEWDEVVLATIPAG